MKNSYYPTDLTKLTLEDLKEIVVRQNINPFPLSVMLKIIQMNTKKEIFDTLEKWINPLSKHNKVKK